MTSEPPRVLLDEQSLAACTNVPALLEEEAGARRKAEPLSGPGDEPPTERTG